MDIDYNKLKFFLAVVRHQSVTAAAKKLHRTQSAVSQALALLETQLGVKLLTWEGKRLQLTREGKLIFEACESRLSAIDEQLVAIQTQGQLLGGCIEIGMLNDASTNMHEHIFSCIERFRNAHPAVTFKIHFNTSAKIEQALLDRELDLGFLINFHSAHRFTLLEITTEQHLIVTSPQYIQRVGKLQSVRDVITKDLIDIDEHFTCFTPWVLHHDIPGLSILENKLPVITVADFRLIRELVLAGQGIAVVPKHLIVDDLAKGSIVQALPKLLGLRVWVHCARERGRQARLSEEVFLKMLCQ